MAKYDVVQILDLENTIGEDALNEILSDFSCPKNDESGDILMDLAYDTLVEVQHQIGGGVVFLECEARPKLLQFYEKTTNGFRRFVVLPVLPMPGCPIFFFRYFYFLYIA